jgi:hypothetical protein
MSAGLEAQGVPNEFVHREGWTHVFDQAEAGSPEVQAALRQTVAFLDEHLK